MSNVTKTFTREELLDMELPHEPPEGGEIISNKITGTRRWVTEHEMIVHFPDQQAGDAWRIYYTVGSTEQQEQGPWEYENSVEATLVREQEVLVKKWLPVKEEA
jgi:hypothetical protein